MYNRSLNRSGGSSSQGWVAGARDTRDGLGGHSWGAAGSLGAVRARGVLNPRTVSNHQV